MTETVIHRSNPGIDPHFHVWGWEVPIYLFLGGLVAGLMVIAGARLLLMRPNQRQAMVCCTIGPLAGLALLSLGMLALFLDLEHKLYVWRLYLTFEITSPMSWGSWILLAVYPALLANALVHLPETLPSVARRIPILTTISDFMLARPRIIILTGLANVLLGIGLGIYTGILLGALGARPLWNSAVLGPLFLFSGLSSAAAFLHGILVVSMPDDERPAFADFLISTVTGWTKARPLDTRLAPALAQADNSFLTIEFALIGLFFIGHLTSTAVHQQAIGLLLNGPYAAVFWVFVVGLGILLPLILQHFELLHRIRHTLAPALLVLGGGLALRFIIVAAGQASHWSSLASH
ncbi:NrfD/PsrC family molybdoenzyme membrane anchor subunit [Actomonas aquatica]|uniref:NrfD/PsrC family molybdoenzyme membrane anchor subunit n=1 Tax=Actomonas aquatica TaxID=2866162 RepID=A0ABZ1C714_9BACT|nr:NrfD/PsrC family molybdoenzyme membrane anchor subunit [Opitutus sp. WL0086]WRQ86319.1 NrfD/PsrC family molybdoenzyme membrane anchor subunit [Opitutus sp. WL0086]